MHPSHVLTAVLTALGLATALASTGCGDGGAPAPGANAERTPLPGGGTHVLYPVDPSASEDTLVADLRLGSLDGEGPDVFTDVRGFEVGQDGTIYVLDFQTSEVRAFGPDGSWLKTITRSGEGPGELAQANGLRFAPDGSLWINDHGEMRLKVISTEGEELARYPSIVPGFGFVWDGVIDDDGRVWQSWGHTIRGPTPDLSATGVQEYSSRRYLKSFDPVTGAYDSIYVGDATGRSYRASTGTGQTVFGLPFAVGPVGAFGGVDALWTAYTDRYRIARINPELDTLLVVEVNIPQPAVTAEDRRAYLQGRERTFERAPGIRAEVESLIPEFKPILSGMLVDEEDRLWVSRTVPPGQAPRYDVFSGDGTFLGSVRAFKGMAEIPFPLIRNGAIYALVRGEFDIPMIVRAPLPEWLRRG